jgi:hypothetical protein
MQTQGEGKITHKNSKLTEGLLPRSKKKKEEELVVHSFFSKDHSVCILTICKDELIKGKQGWTGSY